VSQILVVANQTLGGDALVEALQDRMTKGPCGFTLLVPATHRAHWSNTEMMGHLGTGFAPHPGAASAAEEDDYARARRRLDVPGHEVGDSRAVGGRPLSAVCRRSLL
jgi:hypothetical protein